MHAVLKWWFFWSGIAANLFLFMGLLWLVWIKIVWPFVEACSITKCTVRAFGPARKNSVLRIFLKAFLSTVGGRDWETTKCRYYTWHGVGNWVVHNKEDSQDGPL